MNFNLGTNHDNEYDLLKNQTQEVINLYGVLCKYIIAEKINKDFIFGEHSHISVNSDSIFELYMLPSETDNWSGSDLFSKFGLQNSDAITMFIGVKDMEEIHPNITNKEGKGWDFILGNLVVFPNNKIMEITNFNAKVEGNNNLFTYNNKKNVYSITLKTYIANRDDYSNAEEIMSQDSFEYTDFGNLEAIFNEDSDTNDSITHRAEDVILEDEIIYPAEPRTKPIRQKVSETNVFGDLG